DRHIIAAIWGVESNYGTAIGERSVIRSTATLACIGRRQAFFREEVLSALAILPRETPNTQQLRGYWAGAFAPTECVATAVPLYGGDCDGDGRRDVVDSVPDLVASTANNLKKDGWVGGQTWGYEVVVPPGFNYFNVDHSRVLTVREWERAGIHRPGGKSFARQDDKAYLLLPAGAQGPAFLMPQNFPVITKDHPAEAAAVAIGPPAARLRGGGPFVQPWPRHERVLTRAERYELQQLLVQRGYDIGEPDGRLGPRSRTALRAFQTAVGAVPDGFA